MAQIYYKTPEGAFLTVRNGTVTSPTQTELQQLRSGELSTQSKTFSEVFALAKSAPIDTTVTDTTPTSTQALPAINEEPTAPTSTSTQFPNFTGDFQDLFTSFNSFQTTPQTQNQNIIQPSTTTSPTSTTEPNTVLTPKPIGENTQTQQPQAPAGAEGTISSIEQAILALKEQIKLEGITDAQGNVLLPAGEDIDKFISNQQKELQSKQEEIVEDFSRGDTGAELQGDLSAYERLLGQQSDLFRAYVESQQAAVQQFQEQTAGFQERVRSAFEPVRQAYTKIIDALANQPSLVEEFNRLTEAAGIPELNNEIGRLQGQANRIEEQIENLPQDVKERVQNFLITQNQFDRITKAEAEPLTKLFNAIARTQEAKILNKNLLQQEVKDIIELFDKDMQRTQTALEWGLKGAQSIAELEILLAEKDIEFARIPFDLATSLNEQALQIGLSNIPSPLQAAQIDKLQAETLKLQTAGPELTFRDFTDDQGDVIRVISGKDGIEVTRVNLGPIGKSGSTGSDSLTIIQQINKDAQVIKDVANETGAFYDALKTKTSLDELSTLAVTLGMSLEGFKQALLAKPDIRIDSQGNVYDTKFLPGDLGDTWLGSLDDAKVKDKFLTPSVSFSGDLTQEGLQTIIFGE